MTRTTKPVQQGDPLSISASEWNGMLEMLRAYRSGQSVGVTPKTKFPRSQTLVPVKRITPTSAGYGDPFNVGVIVDVVFNESDNADEYKRRFTLVADTPTSVPGVHDKDVCIFQTSVANNQIAQAVVSGVTPAVVNVIDEEHEYAQATSGSVMSSVATATSIPILYKPPGTGPSICIVNLGGAGGGAAGIQWAQLIDVGGANGDANNEPTWRYNVRLEGGETILTDIDPTVFPHKWRRSKGVYTEPADYGYVVETDFDGWVVGWINEIPDAEICLVGADGP